MNMTDIEIVGSFKRADSKKGQLQILADLNACSKEDIVEVLLKYGIDASEYIRKKGRKPKSKTEEEVVEETEVVTEEKDIPVPLVPKVVVTVCEEKIARLTEDIENCFERIKEMEEQRDVLCDYIGRC